MNESTHRTLKQLAPVAALLAGGCGLEGLIVEGVDTDHLRPRTTLLGTVEAPGAFPLSEATFTVLTADGTEVEIFEKAVDGNRFDLSLEEGAYTNARLEVRSGGVNLLAMLPSIADVDRLNPYDDDKVATSVTVSAQSTASALGFVAIAGSRSLQTIDAIATQKTLESLVAQIETSTAATSMGDVHASVLELLARADPNQGPDGVAVFRWPEYPSDPDAAAITSALLEGTPTVDEPITFGRFPARNGDLARGLFDRMVREVVAGQLILECFDPDNVRVVLEVNFNAGRLSGLCAELNRFKWVRDEPGKQMFFVGGIHEDSAIQNTEIDALLGNPGSWAPNTIPMYDDGTNGDAVSGDNVWTITFTLPRGLRIGYKYTWGQKGALWTGAEEWPGNQRLLEVVDVNADQLVYRQDNFGDEATNKDLSNDRVNVGGVITWETDADGDGVFDVRERHDLDNDCSPDAPIVTPTGVGPATVEPLEDGSCPGQQ